MSQLSRIDETKPSPKKPLGSFRPHYYTTFQSTCYGVKSNVSTSAQSKELLPIPDQFKDKAEKILSPINELIIEELQKIASFNSVIPNIFFEKTNEFQLDRYLVDRVMIRTLEEADIINWNYQFKKLYPIRTSGNGNCLLHAVLIAMVGVHDISLHLRDQLAQFMSNNKDLLKSHWRIERLKSDKSYGITTEDSKLDEEWKELCELVHYENSEDGQAATHLHFLESVHIFSISNMLRRPIIILSEDVIRNKDGEPISVNDLYGIYLPILSDSAECINEPILLAYDRSHFCPLRTSDTNQERISSGNFLPLYPSKNHILEQTLLPIRFLGEDITAERSNGLIREYLRVKEFDYIYDATSAPISLQCAELSSKYVTLKDNFFLIYYDYLMDFFKIQKPKAVEDELRRERKREEEERIARYGSYDNYTQSPRRYGTSPTRLLDDHLRSRTDRYDPVIYSDDLTSNDGYIPRNGTSYFENGSVLPRVSSDYARTFQRASTANHRYPESPKKQVPLGNPDVLNNLTNGNSKQTNSVKIQIEENKFKTNPEPTQSNSIPIPVQYVKSSSAADDPTLTVYEPRRLHYDPCDLCGKTFYNWESTYICPTCASRVRHSSLGSTPRSQSTNFYTPSPDRTYVSIQAPRSKSIYSSRVVCPKCSSVNVSYSGTNDRDYQCSICRHQIFSASLY